MRIACNKLVMYKRLWLSVLIIVLSVLYVSGTDLSLQSAEAHLLQMMTARAAMACVVRGGIPKDETYDYHLRQKTNEWQAKHC